ncbi:MAG: hypothetical protein ACPGXJ_06545 [Pseudomonadales bacterium]
MMNLLSARWFRALGVVLLSVLLLWMSSNRIVVMLGNQYFEPTYELCVDVLGWIADDVSQLERQIVCNISLEKAVVDAERALAAE